MKYKTSGVCSRSIDFDVVDKIDDTLAKELKEKFGIEDKTIEYIYKYIWGDALVEKLLK